MRSAFKILLLLLAGTIFLPAPSFAETAQPIRFYDEIKPLFAVHCSKCHDAETHKGGLRLDVAAEAMKGGDSGIPAIVPAASARSEILRRITSRVADEMMPPKGPRLTDAEVARIRQWIDQGATWPERDDYWAFQRPQSRGLPEGKAAHPIDRFIEATLVQSQIKPVRQADDRTLLRRVFFDLVGMPPSPEEAFSFFNDRSPDAYEKLIARLLADPRYGERWARHWLDLVRYSESDGYEEDKVRPHTWRYRDYVIRSLNADKPYDRFVQEQLAGDEQWPEDPEAWIATGLARLGPWDGLSKEPAQQRQDFLNDATDVIGAAFLGVTLGCARCHDHKFDVISQADYYSVQAFFAGVKRETRELKLVTNDPEFVTTAFRMESAEVARLKNERDELLRAARVMLEKEREGQPEKKKVEDGEVMKQVEKEHPGRLGKLNSALKSLEPQVRLNAAKVEAVVQGKEGTVRLLKGGELSRPDKEIAPGFIQAMLPAGEATSPKGTRRELARWITSPDNPLTARVLVNRLWQHHFGKGLVATASDFGRNGKPPTHPELLDWLALQFMHDGWSLKKMHRLIMTSAAYRRASSPDMAASAQDPENKLLWRMNRRRVESEVIRDTILGVSGMLNPTMGGPGVYARLPQGVNIEFPNNDKELSWGTATEDQDRRRSIYLFQRRSLTFPLMDVFDAAPMNQSCAARAQTTVAPQALALFNGEFARECAVQFAGRLRREAGGDPAPQIEHAFQLAFTRPPQTTERIAALDFLQEQARRRNANSSAALTDFCQVLLNANELIYAD